MNRNFVTSLAAMLLVASLTSGAADDGAAPLQEEVCRLPWGKRGGQIRHKGPSAEGNKP